MWIKARNQAESHRLVDAVRGIYKEIYSNLTNAEISDTDGLKAFTADGFTLGNSQGYNQSTYTYAAWNWKANGAGSSNTDGSISSTVSVDQTAGISIVKYNSPVSGSGTKTIGHGLGVKPGMIFVKALNTTYNWDVYHSSLGYNASLILNSSDTTRSGAFGAEPTSSVFTAQYDYTWYPNINYVAYCFAQIEGFSAFGKYTGNGSSNGSFVYTGFRPAFVLIKSSSAAYNWHMFDAKRNTYNVVNLDLLPNSSAAEESSNNVMDFVSNGFKLRTGDAGWNDANTYIYMAFAENPFKYALAR